MQAELQRTIEASERIRCEATPQDDWAALDLVLADQLTFIHSTSHFHDKASYLDFLASKIRALQIWRREPPTYRYASGAVLVIGPVDQKLERRTDASAVTVRSWTSQLWTPADNTWKLLRQQSSKRAE